MVTGYSGLLPIGHLLGIEPGCNPQILRADTAGMESRAPNIWNPPTASSKTDDFWREQLNSPPVGRKG